MKQCTKGGCFVALGRTVDARVKLCNLSNEFGNALGLSLIHI